MIVQPRCWVRKCKHFQGLSTPPNGEEDGVFVCAAFTEGIPSIIVHGNNLHIKPYLGDNGIQYEFDKLGYDSND